MQTEYRERTVLQRRFRYLFGRNYCDFSDKTGIALWLIIASLRGPDNNDHKLKDRTTQRIRKAIGGKFFNVGLLSEDTPAPDKPEKDESMSNFRWRIVQELLKDYPDAQSHFIDHYAYTCWFYWKSYVTQGRHLYGRKIRRKK